MPVFMIAMANIRKKKGVAVSMGVLILLSVAIFNVGLTLLAGINHFYDMENDRLGGAHYMVRFTGNEYREEYLDFFLQDRSGTVIKSPICGWLKVKSARI